MEELQNLISFLLYPLFMAIHPVVAVPIIIITVLRTKRNREHRENTYLQSTKISYRSVRANLGRYGEFLIYENLKHLEEFGAKFLFNIYLPKSNGETTEIDVLMLCAKGVFVFESKNYSGWIFGSENQKNWYQTLPQGQGESHKEQFYNPVMQNRTHIKHLKAFLGEQVPMWSVIAFSDRCTLKNIQIVSQDVWVINRHKIAEVVTRFCNQEPIYLLNQGQIDYIFAKLYPYTQIDDDAKSRHIQNVRSYLDAQPVENVVERVTHHLKLHPSPFEMIKNGHKTIEMRLYDEKRQKIKVGDRILFTNNATGEILKVNVVNIHRFSSFAELYANLPLLRCGYTPENVDKASSTDMEAYYSPEQQEKYGVVGIEISL